MRFARSFCFLFSHVGIGLIAASLGLRAAETPAPRPPNLILIMADDMGYSDIGCYGSEIATPNLDRLAQRGVRFSQAYNTARCCPTRAALLTGLYPHQAGVGFMVGNFGRPAYEGYLRDNCPTIPEVLHSVGYRTWMAGKWHVGGSQVPNDPSTWHPGAPDQPGPLDRGFDRFFGTLGGAGSYFRPSTLMEQDHFIMQPPPGFYYTDAIGQHACDDIRSAAAEQRPFFGYVAFTAPHWPLHAKPADIARYRHRYDAGWDALRAERHERLKRMGLVDTAWPLSPRDPEAPAWASLDEARRTWESERMETYAAMIDCLDQNVGKILQCLETAGVADNTIVIFLADNGGCAEELAADGSNIARYAIPTTTGAMPRLGNVPGLLPGPETTFMSYGLPWANASDTPFRQFKQWTHEGGIATPLIVFDPRDQERAKRVERSGQIINDPCHVIDLAPTLYEMAGATRPTEWHGKAAPALPGRSLVGIVERGEAAPERTLFWEHGGNRAVRAGHFKLVADFSQPWELYDLRTDRTELHNLAASQPGKVTELTKIYDTWAASVGVEEFGALRREFKIPLN